MFLSSIRVCFSWDFFLFLFFHSYHRGHCRCLSHTVWHVVDRWWEGALMIVKVPMCKAMRCFPSNRQEDVLYFTVYVPQPNEQLTQPSSVYTVCCQHTIVAQTASAIYLNDRRLLSPKQRQSFTRSTCGERLCLLHVLPFIHCPLFLTLMHHDNTLKGYLYIVSEPFYCINLPSKWDLSL